MRSMMFAALAAATLASGSAVTAAQAQETPRALAGVQSGEIATSYAQWDGRRAYRDQSRYDRRGYYYRRDRGNAAAGIAGLAAGAIIGGAIAQSQAAQAAPGYVVESDAAAYCAQRYRSYDPASGTFLGYDGVRRSCP